MKRALRNIAAGLGILALGALVYAAATAIAVVSAR